MSPRLLNVYMDGVVRDVNYRVLGKGLELLRAPTLVTSYLQMNQH